MATLRLAFDRSVRFYDAEGRLHVRVSPISKATVNPYRGHEIPNCEELGLDPSKVYYLLRDPDELAKAAPSFNNIQLLSKHVPVDADDHQPDFVVGSTGTDAAFKAPYLNNSLVVWAASAIAGIESREVQELSASYRYVADMTPGTYQGLHYDGIMRNIIGNHVALVESGRAGSDVVVGDCQIEGPLMLKSRRALMLSGALAAFVAPKLAADQKFDPSPLLAGVTRKNYTKATATLAATVVRKVTPLLAADEAIDVDDVTKLIGALSGNPAAESPTDPDEIPEVTPAVDDDGDGNSKLLAFLKGKLSDEDMAAAAEMCGGAPPPATDDDDGTDDVPPVDPKEKKDPPAMDAASIRRAARADAVADMNAIRVAEKAVLPFVGEVIAMDSASEIYRFALEKGGVDLTGVHSSAFPAMLALLPKPDAAHAARKPAVAMDAAADADFRKRFPDAQQLKRA